MSPHAFHPFRRIHEPMGLDLLAWLAILLGAAIAVLFHPAVHS